MTNRDMIDTLSLMRQIIAEAHDSLPLDKRESLAALYSALDSKIKGLTTAAFIAEAKENSKKK